MTMLHKKVDKGIKLFGVRLNSTDSPLAMRKSVSMVNLAGYASPEAPSPSAQPDHHLEQEGYASDDLVQSTSSIRERKKGVPWTENEHGLFLIGLQRLGKGDWRGISRNFVRTRTPTQVASHAQKYFLRQSNISKRRRRSSLFDMTPDKVPSMISQEKAGKEDILPEGTDLCLGHKLPVNDGDGMDSDVVAGFPVPLAPCLLSDGPAKAPAVTDRAIKHGQPLEARGVESMDGVQRSAGIPISSFPVGYKGIPSLDPHLFPSFTFYQWVAVNRFDHQDLWPANPNIVKPTPVVPQSPVRIDESLKISELSLNATRPVMEPTPLSFKLLEEGSRHSAFHATSSVGTTDLDSKGSLSSAISVA